MEEGLISAAQFADGLAQLLQVSNGHLVGGEDDDSDIGNYYDDDDVDDIDNENYDNDDDDDENCDKDDKDCNFRN